MTPGLRRGDVSIVLCGEAGQGVQTVEQLLTGTLKRAGYSVFSSSEFMSRIRGGSNSTEIRVSSDRASAFVNRIDILFAFHKGALAHLAERISPNTVIMGEEANIAGAAAEQAIPLPLSSIAIELGNRLYANTVAVGVVAGLANIEVSVLQEHLRRYFAGRSAEIIEGNVRAAERGHQIGTELSASGKLRIEIPRSHSFSADMLLSGTQAVGLGAIAAGCNFISSYPMSPSTGVFTLLAQHSSEFDIIVEQAEDEISAINMALGAWYAGARAMVSTSGGGFALMVEGLSLAGASETPLVIHLGQRPGPATGLPTRTEQGDLLFALHAGHGEFPRVLLAPGTAEDAFYLTQKAFDLADKYQVPVFVLTDQYLLDSFFTVPPLQVSADDPAAYIVETDPEYRRYRVTETGVSPRGIPGFGKGLVVADSHEHEESGHITERADTRVRMVDKRLRKGQALRQEAIAPELVGSNEYSTLIVGWGSTYHVIREALAELARSDVSFLHFKQVYPLHPDTERYLGRAKRVFVVENNATAQFGRLLRLCTGIQASDSILKYDGRPFAVEEVVAKLQAALND